MTKKQQYQHQYYLNNREKLIARSKAWRQNNRERSRAIVRKAYYKAKLKKEKETISNAVKGMQHKSWIYRLFHWGKLN